MSRIAILAASAFAVLALAGTANAAGFNCNQHLNYTERTVCDNPGLSRADSQLNSVYIGVLDTAPASLRPVIEHRQLVWLSERNSCGADVRCLWDEYRSRIWFLRNGGAY